MLKHMAKITIHTNLTETGTEFIYRHYRSIIRKVNWGKQFFKKNVCCDNFILFPQKSSVTLN